uniref:Uncharacterized protein n=1 Tax=Anguilla anguilla TaxID=7936 RepID=A0A0E9QQR4_ANGAN
MDRLQRDFAINSFTVIFIVSQTVVT